MNKQQQKQTKTHQKKKKQKTKKPTHVQKKPQTSKNYSTGLSVLGHLSFKLRDWPLLGRSDVFQWKAEGNENNLMEKEKRNSFPSFLDCIPLGLSKRLYCILRMK